MYWLTLTGKKGGREGGSADGACFGLFLELVASPLSYKHSHPLSHTHSRTHACAVTSITSTSLCLLVSCATSVYSAAFLGCGAFYIIFMLASGFVLQADEIPSYLAPFKYLSFYRYVRLA